MGRGILAAALLSTVLGGIAAVWLADRNPSLRVELVFLPLWVLLFLLFFALFRFIPRKQGGAHEVPRTSSPSPSVPRSTKYDDASWHFDGDFPEDLPLEAGGTHIGMFLAWAIERDLVRSLHSRADSVKRREETGRDYLMLACDGQLTESDLSELGNAFAREYYKDSEKDREGQYFEDYKSMLAQELPSFYHVEDSWENFDRLKPMLNARFEEWRAKRERSNSLP
jgi:hypothetical protein